MSQESFASARSNSLIPKLSKGALGNGAAQRNNRVVINVGGVRYEAYRSTLKTIPDTRLSWLTETTSHNSDYDHIADEYFFDRHPGVFNMILNYYRTGKLHAPMDVCGPLFEEELTFWGIDEKQIEPCCWTTYRTHRDAQETLAELGELGPINESDNDADNESDVAKRFGIQEEEQTLSRWHRLKPRIWSVCEDPQFSILARVFTLISMLFVVLSISVFCMGTAVFFRKPKPGYENITMNNLTSVQEIVSKTERMTWLVVTEYITVAYFTLEFIARFVTCPDKTEFVKSILNWVDLVSIVPFYVQLAINDEGADKILQTIKLCRIFRIFKLTRHFNALKVLVHTLKASLRELLLLILILFMGVLIFATIIYYVEQVVEPDKNVFMNIPVGFWWALVTMTTLGYGDMYPKTFLGYMVGMVCAISGVLVIALPVPVIVNNFALYYSHAQAQAKLPKKQKKVLVGAPDMLKSQIMEEELAEEGRVVTSQTSINTNPDSDSDSLDSGVRTHGDITQGGSGISVIFTDELAEETVVHRHNNKPPPFIKEPHNYTIRRTSDPVKNPKNPDLADRNHLMPPMSNIPGRRHSLMPNGLFNNGAPVSRRGSSTSGLAHQSSKLNQSSTLPPARRRSLMLSLSLPASLPDVDT